MHKAREITFALKRIQKAFPRQSLFVILYEDGSGGLYQGTIRRYKELADWADGETGCQILDQKVRELYLMNSAGYPQ